MALSAGGTHRFEDPVAEFRSECGMLPGLVNQACPSAVTAGQLSRPMIAPPRGSYRPGTVESPPVAARNSHGHNTPSSSGRTSMDRITVISDSVGLASDHAARLARYFETECFQVSELPAAAPGELGFIDIDLRDAAQVSSLRGWLRRRPTNGQVIFGVNQDSHVETIQAYAIGATGLVSRPIDGNLLSRKLSGGRSLIGKHFAEAAADARAGVSSGMNALQTLFAAAISRAAPDLQAVSTAGVQIIESIEEDGLSRWLEAVRKHHSQPTSTAWW